MEQDNSGLPVLLTRSPHRPRKLIPIDHPDILTRLQLEAGQLRCKVNTLEDELGLPTSPSLLIPLEAKTVDLINVYERRTYELRTKLGALQQMSDRRNDRPTEK